MSIADFPQLEKLSIPEKLQIIGELWDSISPCIAPAPIDSAEKAVLDARWAEYLANPAAALNLDETIQRLNDC